MMFKELTGEEVYSLWLKFKESVGQETLTKAYGSYWPRQVVDGEKVWEAIDNNNLVGWCALRKDPVDPIVWQISGVFFEHTNKGYVKDIFRWCIKTTFELWSNVDAMVYSVSKCNSGFIQYQFDFIDKKKPPEKFFVGDINFPEPGYMIFGVKRRIL